MLEISTTFPLEGEVGGLGSIACTESGDRSSRIQSPDLEKREFRGGFSSHVSWAKAVPCDGGESPNSQITS